MKDHEPSRRRRDPMPTTPSHRSSPGDPLTTPHEMHSPEVSLATGHAPHAPSEAFAGAIKDALARPSKPHDRGHSAWGVIPGLTDIPRGASASGDAGRAGGDFASLGIGPLREIVAKGLPHLSETGTAARAATDSEAVHSPTVSGGSTPSSVRLEDQSPLGSRFSGLSGFVDTGIKAEIAPGVVPAPAIDPAAFGVRSGSLQATFDPFAANQSDTSRASRDDLPSITAIDPAATRLTFPGQTGFGRATGDGLDTVKAGGPFAASVSGHFGSETNPGAGGASLDLAKTNDLLDQLLDEIRKGDRPFLPVNDRNTNF